MPFGNQQDNNNLPLFAPTKGQMIYLCDTIKNMEKLSKYQAVCSAIEQANGNPISVQGICDKTNLSTKAVRIAIDYLEESGHIKTIEMKPKSYIIIKKCSDNPFLRQKPDKENVKEDKKCKCSENQNVAGYLPLFAPICPTDYQGLKVVFAPICPYLPLNENQPKLSTTNFNAICPYLPLFAPLIINDLTAICPYLPQTKGKYQNFRLDNGKNNGVKDTLREKTYKRHPKKFRNWKKIANFYASKSSGYQDCSQLYNIFDEKLAHEVFNKYIPLFKTYYLYLSQKFQNFQKQADFKVINKKTEPEVSEILKDKISEKFTKENLTKENLIIPELNKESESKDSIPITQESNLTLDARENPFLAPALPYTATPDPLKPETQELPKGHMAGDEPKKPTKNASKSVKELPPCLTTFEAYKDDLRKFYDEIRRKEPKAVKFIDDMTNRYNNLDFIKTLDMNCKDYWGTEDGYKQKLKAFKGSKAEGYKIDWYKTFTNTFKFPSNRLYKKFAQDEYKGLPHGYMDLNAK